MKDIFRNIISDEVPINVKNYLDTISSSFDKSFLPETFLEKNRTYRAADLRPYTLHMTTVSPDDTILVHARLCHAKNQPCVNHSDWLRKINFMATRSTYQGQSTLGGKKFPTPHLGPIDEDTEVWLLSTINNSNFSWKTNTRNSVSREFGLIHLNKEDCEAHRKCLVDFNLKVVTTLSTS